MLKNYKCYTVPDLLWISFVSDLFLRVNGTAHHARKYKNQINTQQKWLVWLKYSNVVHTYAFIIQISGMLCISYVYIIYSWL